MTRAILPIPDWQRAVELKKPLETFGKTVPWVNEKANEFIRKRRDTSSIDAEGRWGPFTCVIALSRDRVLPSVPTPQRGNKDGVSIKKEHATISYSNSDSTRQAALRVVLAQRLCHPLLMVPTPAVRIQRHDLGRSLVTASHPHPHLGQVKCILIRFRRLAL